MIEIQLTQNQIEVETVKQPDINITLEKQGPSGKGVPAGGTTGQILAKKTSGDFDTEWKDDESSKWEDDGELRIKPKGNKKVGYEYLDGVPTKLSDFESDTNNRLVNDEQILNWDTAFSWGNHAGLYDPLNSASNALSGHLSAFDHSLIATALQSETDPVFTAWDKSTGISITESQISDLKTYIQSSEKGANSGVATLDSGGKIPAGQLPSTVEKVKFDINDPLAGYISDKIIAGSGISVAKGTGDNDNKLVITNDDKGSDVIIPTPSDFDIKDLADSENLKDYWNAKQGNIIPEYDDCSYTYDSGNLETIVYTKNGETVMTITFTYNSGNLETMVYTKNGETILTITFTYVGGQLTNKNYNYPI
jgi:hypothetical protein